MAAANMEQTTDMDEDFKKGKEAMSKKEYSTAAEFFSTALERFVERHGQLAPECGEIYYQYGLALFREVEQNEENGDVFGPQVPQEIPTGRVDESEEGKATSEPSSSKATESSQISTEQSTAAGEEDSKPQEEEDNDEEDKDKDESEDSGEDEEGEENEPAASADNNEGEAAPKEQKEAAAEGPKKEGSEEVEDPLQLAWEVLDTARNIFEKDDTKELRLSDTLLLLGDINLRNEMFELATKDYEQCLSLREQLLKADDRLIMEVHHQVAIARLYFKTPDRVGAVKSLKQAVSVCELRIENLKKAMECSEGAVAAELAAKSSVQVEGKSRGQLEEEVNELEEIKEDLLLRIESEETDSGLPDKSDEPSSSTAGGSSGVGAGASAVSDSLGGSGLAALLAGAGIPAAQVGFGAGAVAAATAAAGGSPVKTLGVFGKRKATSAGAAAGGDAAAPAGKEEKSEGAEGANKRARVEGAAPAVEDISAAATPSNQSPPKAAA